MADYKEIKIDIGSESSFNKLPAQVDVGNWSYFLARNRKGVYQLLSNVCPHQMGEVVDWDGVFMCPDHGWRFEKTEGVCINGPNSRMTAFPVAIEGGRLIATVPDDYPSISASELSRSLAGSETPTPRRLRWNGARFPS